MILAAGLGTRLGQMTSNKPKALVEINGRTLLEIVIEKIKSFGFDDIIINLHHFPEQIINFLKKKNNFKIKINFSIERELLDTGGGLKRAGWFFRDSKPFLVHNVDILSDLDLKKMYQKHLALNGLATLAIRKRETSRYLIFNNNNNLIGWENKKTGEKIMSRKEKEENFFGFSGIQIIDPKIFSLMPKENSFSIIKLYLKLAKQYEIKGFDHSDSFWIDAGKPELLKEAETRLLSGITKTALRR